MFDANTCHIFALMAWKTMCNNQIKYLIMDALPESVVRSRPYVSISHFPRFGNLASNATVVAIACVMSNSHICCIAYRAIVNHRACLGLSQRVTECQRFVVQTTDIPTTICCWHFKPHYDLDMQILLLDVSRVYLQ